MLTEAKIKDRIAVLEEKRSRIKSKLQEAGHGPHYIQALKKKKLAHKDEIVRLEILLNKILSTPAKVEELSEGDQTKKISSGQGGKESSTEYQSDRRQDSDNLQQEAA